MKTEVFQYYLFKEYKALKFEAEYAHPTDLEAKLLAKKLNNFNWIHANEFVKSWIVRTKAY